MPGFRDAIFFTAIVSISGACLANEKNGLPCVAEICLGDGLEELRKLQLTPVQYHTPGPKAVESLSKRFRGDIKSAVSYLVGSTNTEMLIFDNRAIEPLSRVNADCSNPISFPNYAKFRSKSGAATKLEIRLIPPPGDLSTHRWQVTKITRETPEAVTKEQLAEVERILKERYGKFFNQPTPRHNSTRSRAASVYMNKFLKNYELQMTSFDFSDNDRLKHPLCGGNKKISID